MKTIRLMILLDIMLFSIIVNAQTTENPDTTALKSKLKANFDELFKTRTNVYKWNYSSNIGKPYCSEKDIYVMDDKIEFRQDNEKTVIYFLDWPDNIIVYNAYVKLSHVQLNCFGLLIDILPYDDEKEKVKNKIFEKNKKLMEDIILVLNNYNKKRYKETDSFKPIAEKYRSLTEKPPVSEEQRKYIVQANGFNGQKLYDKAIELYLKAIKLDQTAYPAAYSNLALLYAQLNKFDAAIYNMKKYLMLEPESPDARGAQDKIYLWEAQIVN